MTRSFLRSFWVLLLVAMAAFPASAAIGTGSVAGTGRSAGASPTHGWIAISEPDGVRCTVLYLPPRGLISEATSRAEGSPAGEARVAASIASVPVAMGSIGAEVAMVFADGGAGFPSLNGRPVLSLKATESESGGWRALPGQRLDPLASLRADGLLLGFTGSPAGYAALFQGLAGKNEDPRALLLQVLRRDGWVDVSIHPDAQALAAPFLIVKDGKPATTATWRLLTTDRGLALVFVPPRKANEPVTGSVFLADFTGSSVESAPSATWTRRDLTLSLPKSVPTDQIEFTAVGDHLVLTAGPVSGQVLVYTQPFVSPTSWRSIGSVQNVAAECVFVGLDGVGRLAVASFGKGREADRPELRLSEISVRTGATAYEGELRIASPITSSDYRFMAIGMAWVLGLVVAFLWRPSQKDSLHLPEGYSIAEPGRRMMATTIDAAVSVLIACRVTGLPVLEFMNSGVWANGPVQNTLLLSIAILIVAGTVLEAVFGRTLGKLIVGCGVVELTSGTTKKKVTDEVRAPAIWRTAVRNVVKWGLPPIALFGLLDPAGRHRADQLAGTAVVVEGENEEDEDPEE